MQKLKEGQILQYPLDLYLSKKQVILVLALGLLLFPLYYYGIPLAKEDGEWIIVISIWFFIILISFGVIAILLTLISGKPALQITAKGITILQVLRRPQQRYLLWRDVKYVGIDYRVISRNEIWMLVIQPKQGKIIQYPLKSMRYKDYILNEMEIVHLAQLASEQRSAIHYKSIEIERIKLITKKAKWLLLILLMLCIGFYFAFIF